MNLVKQTIDGIYNLLLGLGVTVKHLFKKAITVQYPKERWEMPERSRGVIVLLSDKETGKLNCTACMLCARACPVAAIKIEREKNPETKKFEPTSFDIDTTVCCYCGLCEQACNFSAIKLTGKYEFSVYDKDRLQYDMDFLQEIGRDVKYEKKKKVAKKAVKKAAQKKKEDKAGEEEKSQEKSATKPSAKADAAAEDEKPADSEQKEESKTEDKTGDDKNEPDSSEESESKKE
ncbi:MAG: 4Fe-4S dicluster domain-containing protein [candidate division Zixibacteria bacterium]|nr:4Fe-4S dicluster domain-containing protein [candidate division Zixibacteria bacterium]